MNVRLVLASTLVSLSLFACSSSAPAAPVAASAAPLVSSTAAVAASSAVSTPAPTSAPTSTPAPVVAADPLAALLSKIKDSKTLHLDGTYSISGDDPSAKLEVSVVGDLDLGTPPSSRITTKLGSGADVLTMQTISVGDSAWTKIEGLSDWTKSDGASAEAKQFDPKSSLESLLSGSSIVSQTSENLDGVSTTHYVLGIDQGKLSALTNKDAFSASILGMGAEARTDLWIDGSGNLLKQKFSGTLTMGTQGKLTTTIDMRYSNYGKPIAPPITPPTP